MRAGPHASEAFSRSPSIEDRLAKIENDIVALRTLVRARDDRAQQKLKAGLSSLLNMMAILPQLKISGVIPPFPQQGFEITGEEAAFLYHLIRRHRPKLVMELGSGSSTFLFAAAVRANGTGRVVSIEHDPAHASETLQFLDQADLAEWVHLVKAPLVDRTIGGNGMISIRCLPRCRTKSTFCSSTGLRARRSRSAVTPRCPFSVRIFRHKRLSSSTTAVARTSCA
jgi:hypothetical protein